MQKQNVNIPVMVPRGDFCWADDGCCSYFDNPGGHGVCLLGLGKVEDNKTDWPRKSIACRKLKPTTDPHIRLNLG